MMEPKLRFPEFKGEWESTPLHKLGVYKKSYSYSRAMEGDGEIRHIHYGDIHSKFQSVARSEKAPTITLNHEHDYVQDGEILFADASEDYKDLGKSVIVRVNNDDKVIAGLHTHRFSLNQEHDPVFILYSTKTRRFGEYMKKVGTGISVLGVSKPNLGKYQIALPSILEQAKIGRLFRSLDLRIEVQRRKLEILKVKKAGILRGIFEKDIRFKDDYGKYFPQWKTVHLNQIVERVTRKNIGIQTTLPLTISSIHGLVDQETYFNKTVASENLESYYLLKKGEFAYNKSYSAGYPFGSMKRLNNYEMGALSTLYICFKPLDNVDSDFLQHYFTSGVWHKEVSMISVEGARNHGLLNVSVTDFFETLHEIPTYPEQKKIAKFLNAFDRLITLEEEKLSLLQEQKKGLMQQMFI